MDSIRAFLKRAPAILVLHTLRTIFSMPPLAARLLIAGFTAPTQSQQRWIKHVDTDIWKGAYIAHDINECSDAEAIRRVQNADLVIFEVHGGGFIAGHCTVFMDVFIRWLELLKEKHNINAVIMSIEYGLAPQVKYPVPVFECVRAYEYLTTTLKVPGSRILISGDSAGGALCLETLVRFYAPGILVDHDAPRENFTVDLPAGMVLVSPLVSGEVSEWRWDASADMVTPMLAQRVLKDYLDLPNVNPDDLPILRLRNISKDYHRFAPRNLVIFVGEREVMRDDILNLANNVKIQGTMNVEICREDYPHDWFLIRELVPLKDKPMLDRYDHFIADFAARVLEEARVDRAKEGTELCQSNDDDVIETLSLEMDPKQTGAVASVQVSSTTTTMLAV
ncbi:hypothetical protein EC973_000005 [Apophysomyces ossiformis]|uniref:Alpha/beta hydrolase fold-3 domain-containing protein n=1 Tax=Apophysomyces ossiformis TaxID=679940 RepID=A0A8H7BZJ3_9FUNG|nr:hypothetical protein EC973_000005 [Apophysomyces ossiformis]